MIWKEINGYPDYEVSDSGLVKSKGPIVKRGVGFFKMPERILSPGHDKDGYEQVCIFISSVRNLQKVHRLVAIHFLEPVIGKDCVNHKNGNKKDNRASNLEWCTKGENHEHAVKFKLKVKNGDKPVGQYKPNGDLIAIYKSGIEASRQLRLSPGNISKAARKSDRIYKGFKWKYQ